MVSSLISIKRGLNCSHIENFSLFCFHFLIQKVFIFWFPQSTWVFSRIEKVVWWPGVMEICIWNISSLLHFPSWAGEGNAAREVEGIFLQPCMCSAIHWLALSLSREGAGMPIDHRKLSPRHWTLKFWRWTKGVGEGLTSLTSSTTLQPIHPPRRHKTRGGCGIVIGKNTPEAYFLAKEIEKWSINYSLLELLWRRVQ